MIYDRPVRVLLDECAQELREPFTRPEITEWFRRCYPLIQERTVRAHVDGLTAGGPRNDEYLSTLPPVLERVGRGFYRRARPGAGHPVRERPVRAEHTGRRPAPASSASSSVVLIGCVKSNLPRAAAAKDLYTGALFARRRGYAEATGLPWFVLSSRWGLVAPLEVIAPYDVYLGDMSSTYRHAWAGFVAGQLSTHLALPGAVIEIHAGDHYVNALRPELERSGAVVVDAVDARSLGETLAWYDRHPPRDAIPAGLPADDAGIAELVAFLTDRANALTPAELRLAPRAALSLPGLYSWWVDNEGAADLSRGLGHHLEPGLIYAGLAGATRWPSGMASSNDLWGRLIRVHLGKSAKRSSFRQTIGAILTGALWGGTFDEDFLTAWIDDHLRVVPLPVADAGTLGHMETTVLRRLDPPLNLIKMPESPIRSALSRLRRELSR